MCVGRREAGDGEEMKITADIVYHFWWYAGVDCLNYLGPISNA